MLNVLVGTMLLNFDRQDPEWKTQAEFLAEMLEDGGMMPRGKVLGGICRMAGQRLLSRKQIVEWARSQSRALN